MPTKKHNISDLPIIEVPISEVKMNPNNPRIIRDDKFLQLVQSIKDFPDMLKLRPVVVNSDMISLGGNMRLRAAKEAGKKNIWIIKADTLTEEQQRQFIIKDNIGYGEWDWEMIANEWDADEVKEWGLDVPIFKGIDDDENDEQHDSNTMWFLNIEFQNEDECKKWYDSLIKEGLLCKIVQ